MKDKILIFFCVWTAHCFGAISLENMSLEEKVGQVLMVHFHGETVNDDARTLIQDTKVGGVIYYNWSNGLHSPEQVLALSTGLQKLAKNNRMPIPLLIAADQEGGIVARLQSGFTSFPGNRALGETGNASLAKKAAFAMGQEMLSVGINMDLAPVVDVNSNPRNPIIGIRSFGDTPEMVIAFGEKALEGFRRAGVIATLKHFPGHGDTSVDSHKELPIVQKSKKELEQMELLPFAKLKSADAIMTAHILVPALDPENCSTLSETTLKILREEIGFQGVIVTDSLVMEGVLKQCHSVDEAAIMALNAGCDILLLGGRLISGSYAGLELTTSDIQRIHSSLIKAVKSGRISEMKLNAAVERVLKLKERYLDVKTESAHSADLRNKVHTPEHRALAQQIASLALQTTETEFNKIERLSNKKIFIVAPALVQNTLRNTSLFTLGKSTDSYFFNSLNPSSDEIEAVIKQAKMADVVVVCSYNAWRNLAAVAMTESLLGMKKPLILLSLRDSLDASLFSSANLIFKSFSPTEPSIQAICDELAKRN